MRGKLEARVIDAFVKRTFSNVLTAAQLSYSN